MTGIETHPARLPWSSKLARLLVCMTWPMIWVGGLVTTYDAGMSVPDWPGTYGYNLLLYPLSTWLLGPFDLFIEHGHRLLGASLGFVAIGFLIAAWRTESRRWVVCLAGGVLIAVIAQGILGGLRVTQNARTLAMVHGCTATAFFGLCVVAAIVTGRRWSADAVSTSATNRTDSPSLAWPIVMMLLAYGQLVMGAMLRHTSPMASATGFGHIASTHVTTAFVLWAIAAVAHGRIRRFGDKSLSRFSLALVCLVGVQITLGLGTWIVNYGFPRMLAFVPGASGYLLQSKDFTDALIVTAHVAVGSLIFAVATALLVRIARRRNVLASRMNIKGDAGTSAVPMDVDQTTDVADQLQPA